MVCVGGEGGSSGREAKDTWSRGAPGLGGGPEGVHFVCCCGACGAGGFDAAYAMRAHVGASE